MCILGLILFVSWKNKSSSEVLKNSKKISWSYEAIVWRACEFIYIDLFGDEIIKN